MMYRVWHTSLFLCVGINDTEGMAAKSGTVHVGWQKGLAVCRELGAVACGAI